MGFFDGNGGGVSDVAQAYAEENGGVAVTGTYPVVATGSAKVKVNSSGGAVTITPNGTPDTDAHLKVVDVNGAAGTNIITVTGLGTIQTDFGSMEWVYNGSSWDLWEASRELFTRNAATNKITVAEANDTLVADTFENESGSASLNDSGDFVTTGSVTAGSGQFGNAASNYTASGDEDVDGFTALEANVEYNAGSYRNVVSITDLVDTGTHTIHQDTTAPDGSKKAWNLGINQDSEITDTVIQNMIDNPNVLQWSKHDIGSAFDVMVVDLTSQQQIDNLVSTQADANRHMSVLGCNDWNGSTGTWVSIYSRADFQSDGNAAANVEVDVSYRYIKYRVDNTTRAYLTRPATNQYSYASSTNEFIHNKCANGEPIATGSAILLDENDTAITAAGKLNVKVSTDSGSTFGSSIDYNTLKSNAVVYSPDTAGDNVRFKLQLIGAQRLKSANFPSQSAAINLSGSGKSYAVDGSNVETIDTKGNRDFIGSATVLTEGANVAVNGSVGPVFTLQVDDENFTIDNPTNIRIGKPYYFFITQDDVAARTITWGTAFKFAGGSAETLTASTGAVDMYVFISHDGSTLTHLYSTKNIS